MKSTMRLMNAKPRTTQTPIAIAELTMRFRSSSRCSRNDIFPAAGLSSASSGGIGRAPDWGLGNGTKAMAARLRALVGLADRHVLVGERRGIRRRRGDRLRFLFLEGRTLLLESDFLFQRALQLV